MARSLSEDIQVAPLTSFVPDHDGGFWVNGFINKSVSNPGASHVEMIRQVPDVFGVTPDGMPVGNLEDIWLSDEYEAWFDANDDQAGALKLGVFGTGWVRGSADYQEFAGFTGTMPSLLKAKSFILNVIKKYQPTQVYIDIMSGNNMDTKKINMGDRDEVNGLMSLLGVQAPATENTGGAAANSAPIGTGMFDTEDDIAGGVMMQFEDEGERDNVAFLKAMTSEELNDVLKQVLDAVGWQADKNSKSQLRGLKIQKLVNENPQQVIDDWVDGGALFPVISGFYNTAAGKYEHQGDLFSKWLHGYTGDGDDWETHQRFRQEHPDQWAEYVDEYLNS